MPVEFLQMTPRTRRNPVAITREAHQQVVSYCDAHDGKTITRVVESVVLWFCRQPEVVQAAVLADFPAEVGDAYATTLRLLAKEVEARSRAAHAAMVTQPDNPASVAVGLPVQGVAHVAPGVAAVAPSPKDPSPPPTPCKSQKPRPPAKAR